MGGGFDSGDDADPARDRFRDGMARWASGVTIVAARHESRVHAATVTAFFSVSLDPPLIAVSLGPNAITLPFLQAGADFGVSILAEDQRRTASDFADVFPVGPSPFVDEGTPLVRDALVGLACMVYDRVSAGDHHIILGLVHRIELREDGAGPLLYHGRDYRRLAD